MNQATFIGNLVSNAVSMNANGNAFIRFSIAVNRKYKGNNETMFIDCIKNGDNNNLLPYLTKGQKIAISGRVSCHAYMNKDNKPVASLDLSVYDLELVGSKNSGQQQNSYTPQPNVSDQQPSFDPSQSNSDNLPF